MTSRWHSVETTYARAWGGRTWAVRADGPNLGLANEDARLGPLLGLDGLKDASRADGRAFGAASLVGHEARFDRAEAAYEPAGWPSLRVRAAWSARGEDVMDLEVQAQAFTVGDLEAVEVGVRSVFAGATVAELPPLDEARLASLRGSGSSLPIPPGPAIPPLLADFSEAREGRRYYLELIHPDDGVRRAIDQASGTARYALFGHDLERGVIVRGRLRGIWLASRPDEAEVTRQVEAFLKEPPPLGD